MPRSPIIDRFEKYVQPFRVSSGKGFRLENFDTQSTCGLQLDKSEAAELLQAGTDWLAKEQDLPRRAENEGSLSTRRPWDE